MSALLVLIFVLVSPSSLAALDCDRFNSEVEGTYWDEILQCPSCLATEGCGYCLSSLRCEAGNDEGPSSGRCSNWIFGGEEACPRAPNCQQHDNDCEACTENIHCGYCGSTNTCHTIVSLFQEGSCDDGGVVFDSPCPSSFIAEERVVGNLQLIDDPAFGGAHLQILGPEDSNSERLYVV